MQGKFIIPTGASVLTGRYAMQKVSVGVSASKKEKFGDLFNEKEIANKQQQKLF